MKEYVLITGGTSGIGREFVRLFSREDNVVVIARDIKALIQIKKECEQESQYHCYIIQKDLSDEGSVEEIYQELNEQGIFIKTLINNAGVGDHCLFCEGNLQTYQKMIQLNIRALTEFNHIFIQDMVERGKGSILNVASIGAFQPGPYMSVYYASKAYVLSLSEALYVEMKGTGVFVGALCPGPTKTNFQQRAHFHNEGLKVKQADPSFIALLGYEQIKKRRVIVINGVVNRLMILGIKFLPRGLIRQVGMIIQRSRSID